MQNPRGTYDIMGKEMAFRNYVVQELFTIAKNYGFLEIQTPIFEHTELFIRSVGEATDIVSKEMYTFNDKKNRSITLRPELTAPVVRSFIQNKLYATNATTKVAYFGPAFRYERPQTGRFRQFHQFGVESFGSSLAIDDAEIITLCVAIIKTFNLENQITLKINSLGLTSERLSYIEKLKTHVTNNKIGLCDDCLQRLATNPLRILDCKKDQNHVALLEAPKLIECLSEESRSRFNQVLNYLDIQDIKYTIDDKLVRGLDYYNDTVFELEYKFDDGKSLAILGGGRYDNLVSQMGGNPTAAFGFGIGIERLLQAIEDANSGILDSFNQPIYVYFVPLCEEAIDICFKSMNKLRYYGVSCDMNREIVSMKSTFKKTDKNQTQIMIVIGEDELKNNKVSIKNLHNKETYTATLMEIEDELIEEFNNEEN